ncbi:hypothetical protein T06_399 [Trichinella sp. T6]|nr:hypothetical protein T06_399 [Trichinella sp. T6]
MEVSSVIKRYSYRMIKTNRLVKKASTTVLTRLIEISKQYCVVIMFSMSCIICMDMNTKTGYITKKLASLLPVKLNREGVKTVVFYYLRQLKKNAKNAFYMADKQEMYPLQFRKRSFYFQLQMNRNSLGQNVKVVWITLLCFRYDLQLIFSR